MKKLIGVIVLMNMVFGVVQAQKLNIKRIELLGEKMSVYYSLDDNNPNHEYAVSLYSSRDNFATPLIRVAGDVGNEVKPGEDRRIEWSILQELGAYRGDLAVEVRARVYVPFVKITSFDPGKTYKRGRTYPLLWTSGNMGGQVDLELYDGQDRIYGERNVPNTGKYEWFIPGSVKPGKDYRLRFTNTRNRDEFVISTSFRIVPRIPFGVKAGAALLLLGGGATLATGLGGGEGSHGSKSLPGAPDIPTGN